MREEDICVSDPVNRGRLDLLRRFLGDLRSPAYLEAKAHDFGAFTLWALWVTAVFMLCTILWDYTIDPVNARRAVWLRLIECGALLLWASLARRRQRSMHVMRKRILK